MEKAPESVSAVALELPELAGLGSVDLSSALEAALEQPVPQEQHPVMPVSMGKKKAAAGRPSAMSLFAPPPTPAQEQAVEKIVDAPVEGAAKLPERAADSVKFAFYAVEDPNLKYQRIVSSCFFFWSDQRKKKIGA